MDQDGLRKSQNLFNRWKVVPRKKVDGAFLPYELTWWFFFNISFLRIWSHLLKKYLMENFLEQCVLEILIVPPHDHTFLYKTYSLTLDSVCIPIWCQK